MVQPLVKNAISTKNEDRTGIDANTNHAKLAKYEVNMRSFHPNKQFERGGFRFHGDNRGFSLEESYFEKPPTENDITSRIWQRYQLDMALEAATNLTKTPSAKLKQESNPSDSGPWPWSMAGSKEDYKKKEYKPSGTLEATKVNIPHNGQKEVEVRSWYGGENHAFLFSRTIHGLTEGAKSLVSKDAKGWTPVPVLDARAELSIKVERIALYMDILSLVYGDGFPNCEAFIKDSAGNKVFLGTHVRIGAPATHLAGDNKRLMYANAIRVEIDRNGNFGEQVWVFAQVVGGPPALREEYPTERSFEVNAPYPKPHHVDNPFTDRPPRFIWNCGKLDSIVQRGKGSNDGMQPIHLSAFTPIEEVRKKIEETWAAGPLHKITRTEWNDYHLHRNPNEGRSEDYYDVSPEKWKKQL